ncbi:MAG: beta-ketoacyl-ACP synthase II [Nitrospirae bacterium]|nr:beta-ketoacyl-ACP synthase II [Nitrospirota bacterium]
MKRRVVVTGLGAVTAIGQDTETFWKSLINSKSGIKRISFFDASNLRSQIAGEITDFDPNEYLDKKESRDLDRVVHLAASAAAQAVRDSDISLTPNAGIVVGTGLGGITTHGVQHDVYHKKGPRFVHPLSIPMAMYNACAAYISQKYKVMGQGFTVTTACASGTHAIGEAYKMIRHGYADVVISGGADATISHPIFAAWCSMRVLSKRNDSPETACRPFSKDRDGMVLGEGAGFIILEEAEHALKRSAKIYAEVVGYASSHDASHITAPDVNGQTLAISSALKSANLQPSEVNYISSHGTGTLLNDKVETMSIKTVFGEGARSIPVSTIKSAIGHTLGASGAISFVSCCLALRDNIVPPTINYSEPDPECDLDYVPNAARKAELNIVMSNAFGFGGNNGVLLIKRFRGGSND